MRNFEERTEAKPDAFVRYEYRTRLLNECRHEIEEYLHAAADTCVFVPNATNGIEAVLRNMTYHEGDVVILFATVYEAFANTMRYLTQTTPLRTEMIDYTLPVSDNLLCEALERAVGSIRSAGLKPKLVLFDTISTLPGVRMPFERLTELCRKHNVLSCIDGAHGAGQIPLDLRDLDPDFFVTNCHKWLYTPRGCGVLYVPKRNQHMMRSTLPTSFGYETSFVANFAYIGTLNDAPYLCVPAALKWRARLEWQGRTGEDAITSYTLNLAREGGKLVAKILGTEVLENEEGTLGNCAFTNVRLPLHAAVKSRSLADISDDIMKTMIMERKVSVNVFPYAGAVWARFSVPVYVMLEDFDKAAKHLLEICAGLETCEYQMGAEMIPSVPSSEYND